MRPARALWLLGLSVACSGCALVEDGTRNLCVAFSTPFEVHRENARNKEWAETAWQNVCMRDGLDAHTEDYAQGFKDGFAEYLFRGGDGEPPLVAPLRYRHMRYQNPQGYQAIQDWFGGYRQGTAAAQECGARKWITGPSSLQVESHPPETHEPLPVVVEASPDKARLMPPPTDVKQAQPSAVKTAPLPPPVIVKDTLPPAMIAPLPPPIDVKQAQPSAVKAAPLPPPVIVKDTLPPAVIAPLPPPIVMKQTLPPPEAAPVVPLELPKEVREPALVIPAKNQFGAPTGQSSNPGSKAPPAPIEVPESVRMRINQVRQQALTTPIATPPVEKQTPPVEEPPPAEKRTTPVEETKTPDAVRVRIRAIAPPIEEPTTTDGVRVRIRTVAPAPQN